MVKTPGQRLGESCGGSIGTRRDPRKILVEVSAVAWNTSVYLLSHTIDQTRAKIVQGRIIEKEHIGRSMVGGQCCCKPKVEEILV